MPGRLHPRRARNHGCLYIGVPNIFSSRFLNCTLANRPAAGELRNGDRPTGAQIARHLESVFAALPPQVKTIYARADSGFYCREAVEAYENKGVQFIVSASHRRRRAMRVSPPAGGLAESLSVHRRALREEAQTEGGG
jgi:hypothetical protein